jgi:hypothetical protein
VTFSPLSNSLSRPVCPSNSPDYSSHNPPIKPLSRVLPPGQPLLDLHGPEDDGAQCDGEISHGQRFGVQKALEEGDIDRQELPHFALSLSGCPSTTSTVLFAWRNTSSETLPIRACSSPDVPSAPRKMESAPTSSTLCESQLRLIPFKDGYGASGVLCTLGPTPRSESQNPKRELRFRALLGEDEAELFFTLAWSFRQ